jgi:hypothetical protein
VVDMQVRVRGEPLVDEVDEALERGAARGPRRAPRAGPAAAPGRPPPRPAPRAATPPCPAGARAAAAEVFRSSCTLILPTLHSASCSFPVEGDLL